MEPLTFHMNIIKWRPQIARAPSSFLPFFFLFQLSSAQLSSVNQSFTYLIAIVYKLISGSKIRRTGESKGNGPAQLGQSRGSQTHPTTLVAVGGGPRRCSPRDHHQPATFRSARETRSGPDHRPHTLNPSSVYTISRRRSSSPAPCPFCRPYVQLLPRQLRP